MALNPIVTWRRYEENGAPIEEWTYTSQLSKTIKQSFPMKEPTVGRIVMYRFPDGRDFMAFITKVWSTEGPVEERLINVTVLEDNGGGAMMNNVTSAKMVTQENNIGWYWPEIK